MIETLAAEWVIDRLTEADFDQLDARMAEQERAIARCDLLRIIDEDRLFHETLCLRAEHRRGPPVGAHRATVAGAVYRRLQRRRPWRIPCPRTTAPSLALRRHSSRVTALPGDQPPCGGEVKAALTARRRDSQ